MSSHDQNQSQTKGRFLTKQLFEHFLAHSLIKAGFTKMT